MFWDIISPADHGSLISAWQGTSEGGYCIPALTFTSPTPETLQSVAFCDIYSPGPQGRSRTLSLGNSRVLEDMSSQSQKGRAHVDERSFLAVPLKSEGTRRREPKISREKLRIWTRTWRRISHLPQTVLTLGASTSPSGSSRRGQVKDVDTQVPERLTPFDGVAELEECSFHGIRRRPLFGIPTLARRRPAKRHDPSKRYSIPF